MYDVSHVTPPFSDRQIAAESNPQPVRSLSMAYPLLWFDLLIHVTPPSVDGFMDLKFFLEELLGVSVDLVTNKSMRPLLRPIIEQEAIRVA